MVIFDGGGHLRAT